MHREGNPALQNAIQRRFTLPTQRNRKGAASAPKQTDALSQNEMDDALPSTKSLFEGPPPEKLQHANAAAQTERSQFGNIGDGDKNEIVSANRLSSARISHVTYREIHPANGNKISGVTKCADDRIGPVVIDENKRLADHRGEPGQRAQLQ